jgi:hypothetical protein
LCDQPIRAAIDARGCVGCENAFHRACIAEKYIEDDKCPRCRSSFAEELSARCPSRAPTTEAEARSPTGRRRRATRVRSGPKATPTTTCATANHRNADAQAKARGPTEGDSEDSAPRHMASFRRQSRRTPRYSCASTSTATRVGTRPFQGRKGVVRDAKRRSGDADRGSKRGLEWAASRHNKLVPRNCAPEMVPMG